MAKRNGAISSSSASEAKFAGHRTNGKAKPTNVSVSVVLAIIDPDCEVEYSLALAEHLVQV